MCVCVSVSTITVHLLTAPNRQEGSNNEELSILYLVRVDNLEGTLDFLLFLALFVPYVGGETKGLDNRDRRFVCEGRDRD